MLEDRIVSNSQPPRTVLCHVLPADQEFGGKDPRAYRARRRPGERLQLLSLGPHLPGLNLAKISPEEIAFNRRLFKRSEGRCRGPLRRRGRRNVVTSGTTISRRFAGLATATLSCSRSSPSSWKRHRRLRQRGRQERHRFPRSASERPQDRLIGDPSRRPRRRLGFSLEVQ